MRPTREYAEDIAQALKESYLIYTAFNTVVDVLELKLNQILQEKSSENHL